MVVTVAGLLGAAVLTAGCSSKENRYPEDRARFVKIDKVVEELDTDPIQYEIVLFLAERDGEFASDAYETSLAPGRLFIVGDAKQSIYRFRGAEARLFRLGKRFVEGALAGQSVTIPVSRRCAPAVIEAVNRVFAGEPLGEDFETHVAHTADLPGRVEVLPLARDDEGDAPVRAQAGTGGLRDPLTTPRPAVPEAAREAEARQLARRIGEIVGHWAIRIGGDDRRARNPQGAPQ